mgnify:FL=1
MAITARELAEKLLHDTAPVEDNKYLLVNEIEQEILAAEQRGRKSVLEHFDEDNIRRTWMNYLDDIIEKEGGYEYDHFHSIIETHRAHLAKIKEPSTEKESSEQVDMSQKEEKNDTSKEHVARNDMKEFEEWWMSKMRPASLPGDKRLANTAWQSSCTATLKEMLEALPGEMQEDYTIMGQTDLLFAEGFNGCLAEIRRIIEKKLESV